jgi:hypothetical protein
MITMTHGRPLPDWNTLTFSFTETDYIYRADERGWTRLVPESASGL